MIPIERIIDDLEYIRDLLPPIVVNYGDSDLLEIHNFIKSRLIEYYKKLGLEYE